MFPSFIKFNSTQGQISNNENYEREVLSKIAELKKPDDVKRFHLTEIKKMISLAYKEGIWKKILFRESVLGCGRNVLQAVCKNIHLNLVRSIIENFL